MACLFVHDGVSTRLGILMVWTAWPTMMGPTSE